MRGPQRCAAHAPRSSRTWWTERLAPWAGPDDGRSARQLTQTAALYALSWAVLAAAWSATPWLAPPAALPCAALTVRLFVIAHDCGHGSYFTSRRLADAVAFVIGVAAVTPHRCWRRYHAGHHAHSGKLDDRAQGDIPLWTVREYARRPPLARALYRAARHPAALIGGATFAYFALVLRMPLEMPKRWRREWRSVWATNGALAALAAAAAYHGVLADYAVLHVMVIYAACALAGWITHSQHQHEQAYWRTAGEWTFADAALKGSTHLALPRWLAWVTADIGLHHVHHLCPRIPNYRLGECARAVAELSQVRTIGWREAFAAYRYKLWDEDAGRLVAIPGPERLRREARAGRP